MYRMHALLGGGVTGPRVLSPRNTGAAAGDRCAARLREGRCRRRPGPLCPVYLREGGGGKALKSLLVALGATKRWVFHSSPRDDEYLQAQEGTIDRVTRYGSSLPTQACAVSGRLASVSHCPDTPRLTLHASLASPRTMAASQAL